MSLILSCCLCLVLIILQKSLRSAYCRDSTSSLHLLLSRSLLQLPRHWVVRQAEYRCRTATWLKILSCWPLRRVELHPQPYLRSRCTLRVLVQFECDAEYEHFDWKALHSCELYMLSAFLVTQFRPCLLLSDNGINLFICFESFVSSLVASLASLFPISLLFGSYLLLRVYHCLSWLRFQKAIFQNILAPSKPTSAPFLPTSR